MFDEYTLALLGDKSAQDRITDREELLPCHCINSNPELIKSNPPIFFKMPKGDDPHYVVCRGCGSSTALHRSKRNAIKEWNTRSPLLNRDQIKKLEN